jgi:hypothetical protein
MTENRNHTDNKLQEPNSQYGFVHLSEDDKLLRDALRPDMEKLQLFTKMLRRNALLSQVEIQHK